MQCVQFFMSKASDKIFDLCPEILSKKDNSEEDFNKYRDILILVDNMDTLDRSNKVGLIEIGNFIAKLSVLTKRSEETLFNLLRKLFLGIPTFQCDIVKREALALKKALRLKKTPDASSFNNMKDYVEEVNKEVLDRKISLDGFVTAIKALERPNPKKGFNIPNPRIPNDRYQTIATMGVLAVV
jgi:hypothetical protein